METIVNERLAGEDPGKLAYYFHEMLARQIKEACVRLRMETGCNKIALSGGVFQNRLLLGLTDELLADVGFQVLRHSMIPPNDGGIALGQAVYAMQKINEKKE